MKIVKLSDVVGTEREVHSPVGAFTSNRIVVEADKMGYGMTKTILDPSGKHSWHYRDHLESCYCISGRGELTNDLTGEVFEIVPDTTYLLDKNDPHTFEAFEQVVLICVFNPPLVGTEVHNTEGSYEVEELSPVYDVRRVPMDLVKANDYNPNSVAPPEMALLETSIWEDGYTQPIVTFWDEEAQNYIVVDGFHRFMTMSNSERIREREQGYLPVVVIKKALGDRMASTIRHNRARGTHNIELMSTIVSELVEMGKGDRWICQHIGMSQDELLRLKQITGVAALFANREFSQSWGVEADEVGEEI